MKSSHALLLFIASVAMLFSLIFVTLYGPSNVDSYEKVFDSPPPDFVSHLKTEHHTYDGNERIYVGFVVPSTKVDQMIEGMESQPLNELFSSDTWPASSIFRNMGFPGFPSPNSCLVATGTKGGGNLTIVFCRESGHIFAEFIGNESME